MLKLVGSRARGTFNQNSDFDYVTDQSKREVLNFFKRIGEYTIQKDGEKYLQLEINGNHYDIWFTPRKYFKTFAALRKIDKGHLIGLKKEISKLGYTLTPYGVSDSIYVHDIFSFLDHHKNIKEKYYKYLV